MVNAEAKTKQTHRWQYKQKSCSVKEASESSRMSTFAMLTSWEGQQDAGQEDRSSEKRYSTEQPRTNIQS